MKRSCYVLAQLCSEGSFWVLSSQLFFHTYTYLKLLSPLVSLEWVSEHTLCLIIDAHSSQYPEHQPQKHIARVASGLDSRLGKLADLFFSGWSLLIANISNNFMNTFATNTGLMRLALSFSHNKNIHRYWVYVLHTLNISMDAFTHFIRCHK